MSNTLATIGGMLDDGLAPTNPLDAWGTGADTRNLFGSSLRAMAGDPGVGVTALAVDMVTEFDGDIAYADAVLDVANSTDAPLAVLASVPSAIDGPTAQRLRDNGIPVLEGFRSGLAALGHLARWPLPVEPMPSPRPRRGIRAGASAFELLAAYGIPIVETRTADSLDEALAAAGVVGYPVALKTFGALHKTDVGGVALGLGRILGVLRSVYPGPTTGRDDGAAVRRQGCLHYGGRARPRSLARGSIRRRRCRHHRVRPLRSD